MATEQYNDVLKRAQGLTPDEQQKLIAELARAAAENGNGSRGKTLGECFRERGWVGMAKDGPADLSTNPKYMEGFGEDGQ